MSYRLLCCRENVAFATLQRMSCWFSSWSFGGRTLFSDLRIPAGTVKHTLCVLSCSVPTELWMCHLVHVWVPSTAQHLSLHEAGGDSNNNNNDYYYRPSRPWGCEGTRRAQCPAARWGCKHYTVAPGRLDVYLCFLLIKPTVMLTEGYVQWHL